jgi:NAD(P)-dependent dehydrogenase (short-subunit alcohol dehydrogenase family)
MGSISQTISTEMMGYRISKAALNEAWKCVSIEMEKAGVIAMVIHPGWLARGCEHRLDRKCLFAEYRLVRLRHLHARRGYRQGADQGWRRYLVRAGRRLREASSLRAT